MIQEVIREFDSSLDGLISEEERKDLMDEMIKIETCDKETNTEALYRRHNIRRSQRSQDSSISSTIRRSQTFSPACRPGSSYICRVSNSIL